MLNRKVNSTVIKEVSWDNNTLKVELHNGSSYDYEGVSRYTAQALSNSKSVGKYFLKKIKNKYPTKKVK